MYRPFHIVLSLILCAVVPTLFGCQNGQSTSADAGKASGNAVERPGAPPIPNNLSPEVKKRIADEQAQFQARSQQQQQQAQTPPTKPGSPK